MVQKNKHLYQQKHLFDDFAFEAFVLDSWKPVEFIKFESGKMILQFLDDTRMEMEKRSSSAVRIKSRKATLSDCHCFLKPGVDICVLSNFECNDDDDSYQCYTYSVWLDAKINSIKRKPHESGCSCEYYVSIYATQGSLGVCQRTLRKDVIVVGIDQICVLQRLEHNCNEDQSYRWNLAEDCSAISETKLLKGKFFMDISWLADTSVIKQVSFYARSVNNKIVYQKLGNDDSPSIRPGSFINVLNLTSDKKHILKYCVSCIEVSATMRITLDPHYSSKDNELSPCSDVGSSKRGSKKPERYLGFEDDDDSEEEAGLFALPSEESEQEHCLTQNAVDDSEVEVSLLPSILYEKHRELNSKQSTVVLALPAYNINRPWPFQKRKEPKRKCYKKPVVVLALPSSADMFSNLKNRRRSMVAKRANQGDDISLSNQKGNDIRMLAAYAQDNPPFGCAKENEIDDFSRLCGSFRTRKRERRKDSFLEDVGFENRWGGGNSSEGVVMRRHYYSSYLRKDRSDDDNDVDEELPRRSNKLSTAAYNEMIDSYMIDIDNRLAIEDPPPSIAEQKNKEVEVISTFEQNKEVETPQEIEEEEEEEEEEMSETDMLWREMEDAIIENCLMEETKDSNALAPTEVDSKKACEHDTRLDEEIGIYCLKCGDVITEIRDVMEPFVQRRRGRRYQGEEQCNGDSKPELKPKDKDKEDDDFHAFTMNASHYEPLSIENDNVWSLIPELSKKMHDHQKKGFQFIWQNIAGTIQPTLMEAKSERRGGCVISHTPGAGKTFLVIAFLVSYLKLFPDKKPLILAPKTTLYTWYKEFSKWEIPIPVYLIRDRKKLRDFGETPLTIPGVPNPSNDVKHVLDCLQKIKKWHLHSSVLVMGYTSFLSLTRENSKYEHKKYMAKALRESTGILILDEGHNPRSTKSRLRIELMKVETELRILLSGTLFQNNFGEYFNTLCLARPKFVQEVLKELDTKQKKGNDKIPENAKHFLETRARKFFLDDIANKIDSSDDEVRMRGLNMLRKMTSGFIDVYESGNFENLPGLEIYTLVMNLTDVQNELLQKLQKKMVGSSVFPLEGELMVTLGSIHPWLIKTATSSNKFYTSQELNQLEKFKSDFKVGSKVRFILSLIIRVVKEEKVLIFCRNLAPMKLLAQLFEECFNWKKGREILLLYGEQDLFERGNVIDNFEDRYGVSKVLLASITACAEGISLTAASRLIFLDSEWNPSKIKQAIARAFRPGQEKMVYVYQLLAKGSMEEDKYRRTTWKEWVSNMIFSEDFSENPSQWQAEKIEDDILREMVENDNPKAIHMIMKNEKASTN